MRRHLLIDPHVPKDGSNSPDPVIDNPLSQNPGRIFASFVHFSSLLASAMLKIVQTSQHLQTFETFSRFSFDEELRPS